MRGQIDDLGKVSVTVEDDDHSPSNFYYENTIVVDHHLGICCISKRPVPAGIPITDTRFWKCITVLEKSVMLNYRKLINEVEELKQIVNSLIQNSTIGTPFSNNFGNSEIIGINQKFISDNFFELKQRISNLEGINDLNFNLVISPRYIIATDKVDITVNCSAGDDTFDSLKVYFNGELKIDQHDIITFTFTDYIEETTDIRVEAIIDGEYSVQTKTVKYCYPFLIGCGNEVDDIIKQENVIDSNNVKGIYDVVCRNNNYIFVVIGKERDSQIEEIKVNDLPTSFEKIEDNNDYNIYKSANTYQSGDYKIFIY